jgi:phage shock protein E
VRESFPARKLNGNDTRTQLGAAVAQVIDRETVRRLIEQGAQIVDVLPAEEYGEDHLPGAVNLPLRKIETEASRALDHARPIVVYCADSA